MRPQPLPAMRPLPDLLPVQGRATDVRGCAMTLRILGAILCVVAGALLHWLWERRPFQSVVCNQCGEPAEHFYLHVSADPGESECYELCEACYAATDDKCDVCGGPNGLRTTRVRRDGDQFVQSKTMRLCTGCLAEDMEQERSLREGDPCG